MIRHVIIATVAFLYLAVSVWFVRKEGQAYRETLRRDRLALAQGETAPAPELKKEIPVAVDPASRSRRTPCDAADCGCQASQ